MIKIKLPNVVQNSLCTEIGLNVLDIYKDKTPAIL